MKVDLLLFEGKKPRKKQIELSELIESLNQRRDYLHSVEIEDLLTFFDALAEFWKKSKTLSKVFFSRNLFDFFNRTNLESNLRLALRGNCRVLDTFCDLGDKKFLFHAQPRGLVVQWLAGNVPIIGLFSILTCTITKNVCIAKASSKGYRDLIYLLQTLSQVKTKKIDGRKLLETIAVVLINKSNTDAHEMLSMYADVRVAWGGEEAIGTIESLRKGPYCEDIIFGPKYSYAVVDCDSLKKDASSVARNLAIDISVFDQYACSSPHTVFVQENDRVKAVDFARELAKQLEFINSKLLPKGNIDPAKAYEIIGLRSEYAITGKVFCSKSTDWTVVFTKEKGLARGSFSRVIFVKPLNDLAEIESFNNRQKQTLGVAMSKKNKDRLLDDITFKGIDRCPDLGHMTFYESPWDGMFVFDRLVRWVTTYK